jgi:light-regulated signal transduction histidine kinase (bacteriophytochrome)
MLDPEGRVLTWNAGAERIEGYRLEEIVGQSFSRFYTPEDAADGKPAQALKTAGTMGHFEEKGWRARLTRLVDDLLDVARIARGKIELQRSMVDLREPVFIAAEDFGLVMHDRGIALHTVVPDEKLWADADATRIAQVVGNLLHNAAKFTVRGGEVTLSMRSAEGAAELSVRDTGAGVDPALLPRSGSRPHRRLAERRWSTYSEATRLVPRVGVADSATERGSIGSWITNVDP